MTPEEWVKGYREWEQLAADAFRNEVGGEHGEIGAQLLLACPGPPGKPRLQRQVALLRAVQAKSRGSTAPVAVFNEFLPDDEDA